MHVIDDKDENVIDLAGSPGRRLRVQRQARGLTVEAVATRLHLKPEVVVALEDDRFDAIPGRVFVTGYLRNYARLVGLDPVAVIDAYQSLAVEPATAGSPHPVARPRSASPPRPESAGLRTLVGTVSVALVIALLAMIALWWHDGERLDESLSPDAYGEVYADPLDASGSPDVAEFRERGMKPADFGDERARKTGRAVTDPSVGETGFPTEADGPLADSPPAGTLSSAVLGEAPSPESSTAPMAGPSSDATAIQGAQVASMALHGAEGATDLDTPPEPAVGAGIQLEFSGPTWVDVRDATGRRVLLGEMGAGERHPIVGEAPFRFTIGRANNTRMTVDGEPFDVERLATGNVARFSYPASRDGD